MRGFGVLFCLCLCVQTGRSQLYPRWFLEQGALKCGMTAVGYANKGFYKDSSASQAAGNARRNLVRQRRSVVSGSQAFWATEAGTAWMGGDLKISADSSAPQQVAKDTGAAEVYFGENMVVSLYIEGDCELPDSMKEPVRVPAEEPAWVRGTLNEGLRIYSVGVAPRYFYESSSWEAAERMALLGLAKEGGDSVAAIEKTTTGSGQQVLNEHISVVLHDYEIIARWFDSNDQVFYVMMCVDKGNVERHTGDQRDVKP